ncbi:hypothetical protein ACO22_02735 [Paracoccidioides brasiliensis]|uniref:Dol-P-Glc:Glc(2)Man(9)GlcNAc(2)-PP-Dol alpha-1,2-glucosyltransferase n=1 Tax=Paracoccidioides brasiliensis TaxID=121759 RepID=A0A1D2JI01_PARBR|nr:hypothetical protein ACO22_02735 [Paracoccidioides brasiliensis]
MHIGFDPYSLRPKVRASWFRELVKEVGLNKKSQQIPDPLWVDDFAAEAIWRLKKTLFASTLLIIWQLLINSVVPDPYLDEVFHVRQAQAYWVHRWRQWDPKITTPPGVYICSYITGAALFAVGLRPTHPTASFFRYGNSIGLFNILQLKLRKLMGYIWNDNLVSTTQSSAVSVSLNCQELWERNLTVLNICLFPPLFFFSGLYYTDIAALLIVVEAYICDFSQSHHRDARSTFGDNMVALSWRDFRFLIYGFLSLTFRQTNIFWVAVFLGGLRVVKTLHRVTIDCQSTDVWRIAQGSWELHQLYDPPVSQASFQDYLKTLVSLGTSAVAHIAQVIIALLPYLLFLGAFGLFVIWNGCVVLGDKEFHTAGLHLPQMLYIWPCFIFFSWPIVFIPFAISVLQRSLTKTLLSMKTAAIFLPLMLITVHFNTVVHPFTLADNRHYVFYIFRILLRHPLIRYLVTPIYFICAWAVLATFSANSPSGSETYAPDDSSSKSSQSPPTKARENDPPRVRVSFVLIWLIASSLSLIMAPLVEPRYFLIPWVIWRLHVPPPSTRINGLPNGVGREFNRAKLLRYLPLLLETAWYIVINVVTGYMFLYRGFEWPQEPGPVQRFMW